MTTNPQPSSLWNRDVPPASDMTFVLATLQRWERRRFRQGLLSVVLMGVLTTLGLMLSGPTLQAWSMQLLAVLDAINEIDALLVSLAVAIVVTFETRILR